MFYFGRDSSFNTKTGLPQITEFSTRSLPKQDLSFKESQPLQKRINDLEGSLKMIEKKYKANLKEGFENKIKSLRLQAVVQRKNIKKSILETKQQIELEQLRDKISKTQKIRSEEIRRLQSIAERKRLKNSKVHQQIQTEKKEIKQKMKEEIEIVEANNKQKHDKILWEIKNRGKKKRYLDKVRDQKQWKQVYDMKKQYFERIARNQQQLKSLQHTMEELMSKQHDLDHSHHHPFLTI